MSNVKFISVVTTQTVLVTKLRKAHSKLKATTAQLLNVTSAAARCSLNLAALVSISVAPIPNVKTLVNCLKMVKQRHPRWILLDRKSTRLNSSHVRISYAVFCLKKKKNKVYGRNPCRLR